MAKSGGNNKMLPIIIGGVVVLAGAAYFFMSGGEPEPAPAPVVRSQPAPPPPTPVSEEVKPDRTPLARTREEPTRDEGRTRPVARTNVDDSGQKEPKRVTRRKNKTDDKPKPGSTTAPAGAATGDLRVR